MSKNLNMRKCLSNFPLPPIKSSKFTHDHHGPLYQTLVMCSVTRLNNLANWDTTCVQQMRYISSTNLPVLTTGQGYTWSTNASFIACINAAQMLSFWSLNVSVSVDKVCRMAICILLKAMTGYLSMVCFHFKLYFFLLSNF